MHLHWQYADGQVHLGEGLHISAKGTVLAELWFVLGGAMLIASTWKIIFMYHHIQPSPITADFLKNVLDSHLGPPASLILAGTESDIK